MIYVVEGIDGSGKSSLCRTLQDYLKTKNRVTKILREPGGTPCAEVLRKIIKDPETKLSKIHQLELFILARHFIVEHIKSSQYPEHIDFILDRFIPSTIAYQHYGFGISMDEIRELHEIITPWSYTILRHSTIIYLKTDPKTALQRITKRGDTPDKFEKLDFLQKVSDGYDEYFNTINTSLKVITVTTDNKDEIRVQNEVISQIGI